MRVLTLPDLKELGFTQSARWQVDPSGALLLSGDIPKKPGVYLFTVSSTICHVGKADKSVHSRARAYVRRVKQADSLQPVHKGIVAAINNNEAVDLCVFTSMEPRLTLRKGLPIDLLVGLEAGLIETLNPPWNPYNTATRAIREEQRRPKSTIT